MIQIISLDDFKNNLSVSGKTYLLLYKKGTEKSDCAFNNIINSNYNSNKITILAADVNQVRDIHPHYSINLVPSLLEFEDGKFKNLIKGCNSAEQYKAIFEDAIFFAEAKKEDKPAKRVIVYSSPICPPCFTLKSYFKKNRIRFTVIDISKDQKAAQELIRRSGQMAVPQTDINGQIVVGFDKNRINELLEKKIKI